MSVLSAGSEISGTLATTIGNSAAKLLRNTASFVSGHPLLAGAALLGYGAYELFGNNPDHLGNGIDTKV